MKKGRREEGLGGRGRKRSSVRLYRLGNALIIFACCRGFDLEEKERGK